MTGAPALSVVIPAYNAARHIDPCLASVVSQDFADFEIVIYDDGSTDETGAKVAAWAVRDRRIRMVTGASRLGAAGSSNKVIECARAPIVARIDADDVMLPRRLGKQAAFLTEHPAAVLVGGLSWTIDEDGTRVREPDLARAVRRSLFPPFAHSTATFRRSAWEAIGGYRAEAEKWEDVDFFRRVAGVGEVWIIADTLGEYRQHAASTRFTDGLERLERAMDAMDRSLMARDRLRGLRLAPTVYRHIGATWLWGGGRPRLLRRAMRRADLGFDRDSIALLGWAATATLAPGLLRTMLRARLKLANRSARRQLGGCGAVRWHPD